MTVGVCVMAEVRSDVWTYFEKEDTNPKKVKRRLCQKLYACCGGTSNLREHLKSMHPLVYSEERSGSHI